MSRVTCCVTSRVTCCVTSRVTLSVTSRVTLSVTSRVILSVTSRVTSSRMSSRHTSANVHMFSTPSSICSVIIIPYSSASIVSFSSGSRSRANSTSSMPSAPPCLRESPPMHRIAISTQSTSDVSHVGSPTNSSAFICALSTVPARSFDGLNTTQIETTRRSAPYVECATTSAPCRDNMRPQ